MKVENENELLEQYAAKLLFNKSNLTSFEVALQLFNNNSGLALKFNGKWENSKEVLEIQERMRAEVGELAFLPTHAELAEKVWKKLDSRYITDKDFVAMARLYGELRGCIKPGGCNVVNDNSVINNYTQNNQQMSFEGLNPIEASQRYYELMN